VYDILRESYKCLESIKCLKPDNMGSFQSHPSAAIDINDSGSSPNTRRARRLMDKLRNRQPSKSDINVQTTVAIDPINERSAQNHLGEISDIPADLGECKQSNVKAVAP
jgi:hypothetical protein